MTILAPPERRPSTRVAPTPDLGRTPSHALSRTSASPANNDPGASLRQLIVGLIALPLTLLPFVGYVQMTPEGRLVRDRALVALSPPTLPELSPKQKAAAVAAAPHYQGPVMVLAYHGIGSASDGEGGFVISPKRFGEHLANLKAAGMHTVTAAEVADAFTGGPALPPNAVMLSFDDGRSDAMMWADPLLAQAGLSATMFVISGAAASPGVYYASWDRIARYARSGRWDIQSHTAASHRDQKASGGGSLPALTSLAPGESLAEYRARVREDLGKAGAAIEEHVGRRPVAFAYPFGAYGADRTNDPGIADVLREEVARRYALAFQQDDQLTVPLVTAEQDRLRLRRLEVNDWSGMELLKRIRTAASFAGVSTGGQQPGIDTPDLLLPALTPNAAVGSASEGGPTTASPGLGSTLISESQPVQVGSPASGLSVPVVSPTGRSPGSTVTAPPAPTVPPSPVVTSPPPTTAPPATLPPPTDPPTTLCKSAGKSGKCRPGQ